MIDLLRRQYDEMVSENARLTALVSEQAREIERLREALLSDCPTVEGDRDHPCWCDAGALNHLQDCWQRRAALAARGGESATT